MLLYPLSGDVEGGGLSPNSHLEVVLLLLDLLVLLKLFQ